MPARGESHTRKRLFAEGAIGVLPRSSTRSDNKSVGTIAGTSGLSCPPNSGKIKVYKWCSCKEERDKESEDMMLICETTNKKNCPGKGYYHQECLGIERVPKGKWLCDFCKQKSKNNLIENIKERINRPVAC
ncbi:transcriptional regulatory protein PHO23-like [Dendronephthya gigantea]|uniref:transcriptional regulatory protein PHO23-like n=1 Tax=Dendronephthya gigantea TaxID=151771 RepID=UPI00106915EB|nr:transcriptional regulatory protein PHO23-like [Dendronephthya gigantea]